MHDPLSQTAALTADLVEQVRALSVAGASRKEIADALGVPVSTLRVWKVMYPHFAEALEEWREEADDDVERALWASAVSGDTAAARFWLTNRRGSEWRNRADVSSAGAVDITVLTGVPPREQPGE